MRRILVVAALTALAHGAAIAQPAPWGPPPAEAPAVPALPGALALEAIHAALDECAAHGWPLVAATILDSGGETKAMLAADSTPPGHAIPRSLMKAHVAQLFRMPSGDVQAKAATDPAIAAKLAAEPAMIPRAGGEPLVMRGVFVGAIGVSGAPGGDKDDQCARAGIARIADRLR